MLLKKKSALFSASYRRSPFTIISCSSHFFNISFHQTGGRGNSDFKKCNIPGITVFSVCFADLLELVLQTFREQGPESGTVQTACSLVCNGIPCPFTPGVTKTKHGRRSISLRLQVLTLHSPLSIAFLLLQRTRFNQTSCFKAIPIPGCIFG